MEDTGKRQRRHYQRRDAVGCGVCLGLEGGAGGLGHIGGTVHPVRNRRPGIFGYRLDEMAQAFVLADGDGEAHVHLAADGYHAMSVEAAVGPYRELLRGPRRSVPAPPSPAESGRRPGRCWRGPRAAGTSAHPRCRRRWPTAGDSPACRYSRGGVRPPWPVRRSRRWWSPGQWSGAPAVTSRQVV